MALSIGEAARRLGVSVSTLRRRVGDGQVRVVGIGRRRLVPMCELERLLGHAN
jgi:excisionase family DNA binding protein